MAEHNFTLCSLNSILNNPKNATLMQSIVEYISERPGYSYDPSLTQANIRPPNTTSQELYNAEIAASALLKSANKQSEILSNLQSTKDERKSEHENEISTVINRTHKKFY
jgi:hypothetical protein